MNMEKPENYDHVKTVMDMYDDLPDGAFFAACAEMGVDTDDIVAVQEYDDWVEAQHD